MSMRVFTVAATALLLAGCEQPADKRASLCARAVPALHANHPAADILTIEQEPQRRAVHITYRLKGGIDGGRLHWIKCSFSPDDAKTGWPTLVAVDTDRGSIGEGRLFVIRRWWFDDAEHAQTVGGGQSRSSMQYTAAARPVKSAGWPRQRRRNSPDG